MATPSRPTAYKVVAGDTLTDISRHFGVSIYNLAHDNAMQLYDVLLTGRVLRLPAAGEKPVPAMSWQSPSQRATWAPSPTTHVVATGVPSSGNFETCVLWAESRSTTSAPNPYARNGSYWGAYQMSYSVWTTYGGSPSSYGSAGFAQQQQVFHNAMAAGGGSNWAPYDGC